MQTSQCDSNTTSFKLNPERINSQPQKISQDLIAGSIAGFANAFCGHPLEYKIIYPKISIII